MTAACTTTALPRSNPIPLLMPSPSPCLLAPDNPRLYCSYQHMNYKNLSDWQKVTFDGFWCATQPGAVGAWSQTNLSRSRRSRSVS